MSGTEEDSSAIDSEHEENDVTDKQNDVSYDVAPSSSRPPKMVVLSPQLIEKYKTKFEMVATFLQMKDTCNGYERFILIVFHLVR